MDHKKVVCLDFTLVALVFVASAHAQYLQVYPGRDANNNGTVPLYFGLMMSFGGDYTSSGGVPGVQVALDQINDDPTMLPGYTLHYILTDSQVVNEACRCTHLHVYSERTLYNSI